MGLTRGIVAALFVMAAAAFVPTAAQAQGLDLTAAYQFQQVSCSGCDGTSIPGGFSVDLAGPLGGMFQWVGQADLSRKSEANETTTLTTFGGGLRASAVGIFAQALAGATRDDGSFASLVSSSVTKFEFELDGGVSAPIGNKTSLVGEVGYRHVAETPALSDFRLLAGIRFTLGR